MQRTLPLAVLILAACTTAGIHLSPDATRGKVLAESRCAGCHAIGRDALQSPNPSAPSFEQIANREGVNRVTLSNYLRDAHNYPDAMQFTLEPKVAYDLADYMLTLRRADYHPAI